MNTLYPGLGVSLIGLLILIYPDIIAYVIGGFLLFVGSIIIVSTYLTRKNTHISKTWKFGSYEVIRKK